MATDCELDLIDRKVSQLFALVSQALGQATHALLDGDIGLARTVVEGDQIVDDLTSQVELLVWEQIDRARRRPTSGSWSGCCSSSPSSNGAPTSPSTWPSGRSTTSASR